jgi:hypothetical protein
MPGVGAATEKYKVKRRGGTREETDPTHHTERGVLWGTDISG